MALCILECIILTGSYIVRKELSSLCNCYIALILEC